MLEGVGHGMPACMHGPALTSMRIHDELRWKVWAVKVHLTAPLSRPLVQTFS